MNALLEGNLPPKGTNFVPDKALCSVCPRRETRPKKLVLEGLNRFHRAEVDPSLCLLAQGLVCFGPATRAGCGALCIRGNMPCTGCFGPTDRDKDYGTRALAAVASLALPALGEGVEGLGRPLPDPAGIFYFYSLARLALGRGRKGHDR
jgi:F420-non-reducing hydrogenase small subunit